MCCVTHNTKDTRHMWQGAQAITKATRPHHRPMTVTPISLTHSMTSMHGSMLWITSWCVRPPLPLRSRYVFNTIIPQKLARKVSLLGLDTPLCNWILDILTERQQKKIRHHHAEQGCPPRLCSQPTAGHAAHPRLSCQVWIQSHDQVYWWHDSGGPHQQ